MSHKCHHFICATGRFTTTINTTSTNTNTNTNTDDDDDSIKSNFLNKNPFIQGRQNN